MLLSLLILGPTSPKSNCDVYMQPLIDELKTLWDSGVSTYDVFRRQSLIESGCFMDVSDFPGYGMLSGWTTVGRLACPYCMERTKSCYLKQGKKQSWFDCHRCFLPFDHAFRGSRTGLLKNKLETDPTSSTLSGDQM